MLLVDNSAWSRIVAARLPPDRAAEVAGWVADQQLGTCLPFLLEAGFSARTNIGYQTMMDEFGLLFPHAELTARVEDRALQAQRQLADHGHHRLAPTDILIAACAEDAGGGVLHYDRDYDVLAEHTGLAFESVWLAPAGSL